MNCQRVLKELFSFQAFFFSLKRKEKIICYLSGICLRRTNHVLFIEFKLQTYRPLTKISHLHQDNSKSESNPPFQLESPIFALEKHQAVARWYAGCLMGPDHGIMLSRVTDPLQLRGTGEKPISYNQRSFYKFT